MNHLHKLLTLILLLAILTLPVYAQESTPEATEAPVLEEAPAPVEEVGNLPIPSAFSTIVFAAPLVAFIVALLKRYLPFPANQLNFYVSLVVYVGYQVAANYGAAGQFEAATQDISSIVQALSNLVIGIGGTHLASAGLYHAAHKTGLPVVGDARVQALHNPSESRD